MRKAVIAFGLILIFVVSMSGVASAQQMGATGTLIGTGGERGAQYYIGSQNELLMAVNVWGLVAKPGQYLVPSTTDLMTLISVAGGPLPKARLDNVRVIRSSSSGSEVLTINIKRYLKTGDERIIPKLQPGDTVIIAGSLGELTSQIVSIIAQLAMVANVYYVFFVK
ncbi:MAG: SLBB domain-containing protein [bacterium]|nr:SLBB domain-containing protein [bacterium]